MGLYKVETAGAPPGDLHVREYYDDKPDFTQAGVVLSNTPNQEVSGIDFALVEGAAVSGRVTDDVTGLPIFDFNVCAEQVDANGNYLRTVGCSNSDADGNYTINGLPLADYRFRACCQPAGDLHVAEWFNDALNPGTPRYST